MLLKIYRFLTPRRQTEIILPHGFPLGKPCAKALVAFGKFIGGVLDAFGPQLPSYLQPPPPTPLPPPEEKTTDE